MDKIINPYFLVIILLVSVGGCKKGFLDASPNKSLSVPETLEDFQSLLDNSNLYSNSPALGEISSDNYYLTPIYLQTATYIVRNCYLWDSNTYAGSTGNSIADWNNPYSNIYVANVVLGGLAGYSVAPGDLETFNAIKGMALFYRAFGFFGLSQLFAVPYNPLSSDRDLGIPLLLTANLDQPVNRATIRQTYNQIIQDLLDAKDLVPAAIPTKYYNRPSKPAIMAMLARVYLSMQDYNNAWKYADSSLQYFGNLIDFNTLTASEKQPFPIPHPEVSMQLLEQFEGIYSGNKNAIIDSVLYNSYDSNDLRKVVFFGLGPSGLPYFKSSYSETYNFFCGFATNEQYLIRAECSARLGRVSAAMNDLNTLLVNRWKTGTYQPRTASDTNNALNEVLTERRKELVFTGGLRWSDLRRLNQDSHFSITLYRSVNGVTYLLKPNDDRYTLLIPAGEINISNIQQNNR